MTRAQTMNVEMRGDREVVITREFNAPRELVWRCHAETELIKQWVVGPDGWEQVACEVDLREGGTYRYAWRTPDGGEIGMRGTFREVKEPERIVHAETFDEGWPGGDTLNTITLTETADGARTLLTMVILYASSDARETAVTTEMTDGMAATYDRLEEFMTTMP